MNCFTRPYLRLGIIALAGATVVVVPPDASGQLSGLTKLVDGSPVTIDSTRAKPEAAANTVGE